MQHTNNLKQSNNVMSESLTSGSQTSMKLQMLQQLWAIMQVKFKDWNTTYGKTIFDMNTGDLSAFAKDWQNELKGLTWSLIQAGIAGLSERYNASFIPNSSEFAGLCKKQGLKMVTEEIEEFIKSNKESWWKTREAYTAFSKLYYNWMWPPSCQELRKQIAVAYRQIDFANLLDIPKPPVAELALQEFEATEQQKKDGCAILKAEAPSFEKQELFNDIWPTEVRV